MKKGYIKKLEVLTFTAIVSPEWWSIAWYTEQNAPCPSNFSK